MRFNDTCLLMSLVNYFSTKVAASQFVAHVSAKLQTDRNFPVPILAWLRDSARGISLVWWLVC